MQERARAAVLLGFGALARRTYSATLRSCSPPEGEAPLQRPRLGPPEVSPERAVVALAEQVRA